MKKNTLLAIWIALFLLVFPSESEAQMTFDNIRKLSVNDGLSNNCVFEIDQDCYGQIWIATEWGINCYNGQTVKKYLYDAQDSCSLSNNFVQAIYSDLEKKEIWIGTDNGLNLYDCNNDKFVRYYHQEPDFQRSFSDIIDIIPDTRNDRLWICSFYAGLSSFDKKTGRFEWIDRVFYSLPHKDRFGINAKVLFDDGNGNIWIGTDGNGIIQYNTHIKTAIRHELKDSQGRNADRESVRGFFLDANNILWVTTSVGLFYRPMSGEGTGFVQCDILKDNSVYAISMVKNEDIWIAGEKGVFSLHKNQFAPDNDVTPVYYKYFSTSTNDVPAMSVRDIYIDANTNIWLSSYTGGAIMLPGTPNIFKALLVKLKGEEKVNRRLRPLCIAEDGDTCLYLGTDGDGIFYQTKGNRNEWLNVRFGKEAINSPLNIIQTLHVTDDGVLWAGTYSSGLVRYDLRTHSMKVYNSGNSQLTGDDVRVIKQRGGEIWVGAKDGLTLFDTSGRIVKTYRTGQNGLYGHDVRQLVLLNDGNLWLTLYNGGIAYLDRKTDTFTTYKHDASVEESLPSNMISDIYSYDGQKIIVVTRDEGVGIFVKGHFRRLKEMTDPYPYIRVFEDKDFNLWASTMNSIQRYNMKTRKLDRYTNINITNVGSFYSSLGLYSQNGSIYFGGENGVVYFEPQRVLESVRSVFKPIFLDFQLFNKSIAISTDENPTPLKRNIVTEPDIELDHDQSQFTIYYATTDFGVSGEMEYAYIMEGENDNWNYVGNRTFAEFSNLPPGKYVFKVKASNQEGVWEDDWARLNITIHPPFWKEPYMYVVYIILSLLALYYIFRFYTYRMRTLNKIRMERMKRDQAEELYQSKLQFFTNVSHEFRTPLTLIAEPVDRLAKSETDEEKKYLLSIVKRNAERMLQLVNQILDLRKIDRGGFRLRLRNADVVTKVKTILIPFEELARTKHIRCSFTSQMSEYKLFFDEELITKCISNILSNAFKFTPAEGAIDVALKEVVQDGNTMLAVSVADTGIGMSPDVLDKIFDRFYQNPDKSVMSTAGSGIGLHLVKELVELHHGKILVESEQGKGSVFTVLLPTDVTVYKESDFVNAEELQSATANEAAATAGAPAGEHTDEEPAAEKDDRPTILVVDDDPDIRNYLKYCLKADYKVLLAEDGAVAWEMIQSHYVDLVLTDLMMPHIDGIQLCSMIKNNIATCHIAVILLTAKTAISSQVEGFETGADGYVPKPFNWELLSALITSVIKRNKQLKMRYTQYLHNSVDAIKEEPVDKLENVPSQNDVFINTAIKIVEEEMGNSEFNGEMLAERLIMSRVHLHRKLKSILNISTSEFIRNIRLRKASLLLLEGNNNISEVCYLTGFSSPAYFSTCFTKFYGVSPRDYVAQKKAQG